MNRLGSCAFGPQPQDAGITLSCRPNQRISSMFLSSAFHSIRVFSSFAIAFAVFLLYKGLQLRAALIAS
jgi:hypothetical protein